ncbi:MAG: glycoside hydrolase/phage tail family protein [Roseivivax sp.]|nr:glycoside hydrolase/phage tail family protein [Roseivivax sp.]
MATILLSAAGAAIGSSIGGTVLGLSATAVGRFVGASIGRAIDQRLLGQGAEAVETGRLDRLRLTGAGEGRPVARVWGRMRVGGHVIWATEFAEHVSESGGGGKGGPPQPKVRRYSYSVSLAVALCEGTILGVSRVWADGVEVAPQDLNMRVYTGSPDQMPDPKMEAVEGTGQVPAYRGVAYVVFEDLRLEPFGNRVPQFSFEVTRAVQDDPLDVPHCLRAVALMPGSGEYALATTPVTFDFGAGSGAVANVHSASGLSDLETSLGFLADEVPGCGAVSLVVSWFGNDLRCGSCAIRPMVEQKDIDGSMPWSVAGLTRSEAGVVAADNARPVYGGTPCDASVLEAIAALKAAGQDVMYYPFVLMDQQVGNGLPDPWGGNEQAPFPWRGRITLNVAPGRAGSTDGTAAADAEVAAFFGTASASDFAVSGGSVAYSGPAEWSFRRFILHNAALCAAAGGVDAFCIGSEMRSLTQIRGAGGFPAVAALKALLAEVRALLPGAKLGYAADWSEYFGYHPQDGSGDVFFHLDPLWSDPEMDFVGIDNYMPLSDWRDGPDHADVGWGAVTNADYLTTQVEGGEGYDWYYAGPDQRAAQTRAPISDGAHSEPWVFRYKDIRNWWGNLHYERSGGVRAANPTAWLPQSKPIWFTELGCAAVDKGANQPNLFLDPKSSESALPYFSNGLRDELMQHQYLRAVHAHWAQPGRNPVSEIYGGPMLDLSRAFVWAWDARPYPWFPNDESAWSDGQNWRRGHWISGRTTAVTLAALVREICHRAGVTAIDTSALHGYVRGYVADNTGSARRDLQPLMLAYGFDAVERDGVLAFRNRKDRTAVTLTRQDLAMHEALEGDAVELRAGAAEVTGRVRLAFAEADGDHRTQSEETVMPDEASHAVSESEVPLSLTRAEARGVVERWLNEARVARDTVQFALPLSRMELGAGDVVTLDLDGAPSRLRIDRVEQTTHAKVDAVRVEEAVYHPAGFPDVPAHMAPVAASLPVLPVFMDLPLMSGDEVPHAPHVAVVARPWPGTAGVYSAPQDSGYQLDLLLNAPAVLGISQTQLHRAPPGRFDRGPGVVIKLTHGTLQSVAEEAVLAGGNLFAIGNGDPDSWELFQARDAVLQPDGNWRLDHLLRGQSGTDGTMPDVWPAGSYVVAMDGRAAQLPLSAAQRGVSRHYRVGPGSAGYDSVLYRHQQHAFAGNGLRPYRPAHLRVAGSGDLDVTWIRRTRIDGDPWTEAEVPLGEERELYRIEVRQGGTVLRQAEVTAPGWSYGTAEQAADGVAGLFEIAVAQVSARFGPGPYAVVVAGS